MQAWLRTSLKETQLKSALPLVQAASRLRNLNFLISLVLALVLFVFMANGQGLSSTLKRFSGTNRTNFVSQLLSLPAQIKRSLVVACHSCIFGQKSFLDILSFYVRLSLSC